MKRANPFVFMLFSAIIGASAQELRLGANESSNAFVPLMERVLADAVITSYSIHYTKLYDLPDR